MKYFKYIHLIVMGLFLLIPVVSMAQLLIDDLHGDELNSYRGWHSGNQIRTTFYNDGMVGRRDISPEDIGEWPKNSGHSYLNLITYFFGAEVKNKSGLIQHIVSEGNGTVSGDDSDAASGDCDDLGHWQTLAPLPGFANDEVQEIAMSHRAQSWPATWPDKFDDATDPGWPGSWNGYFGKNVLNADQESYYVMDDYLNNEFAFYPDSTDSLRRGLGIRGTVRGFQWTNVLVEDVLFELVDVKNIGTSDHAKMNFGIVSGPIIGRSEASTNLDGSDDGASFDLQNKLGWHWDLDDIGGGGWTPVGKHGFAFYESPGNPYDGIDNDDDAINGPGPIIEESMFAPKVINVGDPIIVINYKTFERTRTTMPAEGITVTYLQNSYHFTAGAVFEEVTNNLIDDNFNGIIDENNGYLFGEGDDAIANYLYVGRKYVNYFTGEGSDNDLLDERRDDGIDNDGDWDPEYDDVGLDGVANTHDFGEGDGIPTSGRNTDLPGEPHIDKTDIDESDMIGLTAFNIFTWGNPTFSDDEGMWDAIEPGFLNAYGQTGDTDLMLGSGYFPLKAGDTERFSIGIMFGIDEDDLYRNNYYAKKAYSENYNFAKAPLVPTLKAIPGNNRVTLIWDDVAETSRDPITGYDFEGYRVYRSTDPGWNDMDAISDGYGSSTYRKPIAQFDLINNRTGFSSVQVRGVCFYVGDDTGLTHAFVDTTAVNGYTYYYAVTSYDSGNDTLGISPTECDKYIGIFADGTVEKGTNVAIAKPEAPAAGYLPADSTGAGWLMGSRSDGSVHITVRDPEEILDGHTYQIVFEDTTTLISNRPNLNTKNFSLVDITNETAPDTLINRSKNFFNETENPQTHGFIISLMNVEELSVDSTKILKTRDNILDFKFRPYKKTTLEGIGVSNDYRIEFGKKGFGHSVELGKFSAYDSTNVKIYSISTGEEIVYALEEKDGEDGMFSGYSQGSMNRSDVLIFLEPDANDSLIITWGFEFSSGDSTQTGVLEPGDFIEIGLTKPFLSHDVYQFTMKGESVDNTVIEDGIEKVKVVPNPYVVANSWEEANPYSTGRGPRELHFTHLPPKCTIRIFTVRGQLVQTLEHENDAWDGTEVWDMLTKDYLDISYGVYVYHVEAEGGEQKVGKFAVIK